MPPTPRSSSRSAGPAASPSVHGIPAWPLGLVGLAALLVYLPALRGGFIWNDPDYVTRGELQSLGGLVRIWTEVGATEQYYPLLHAFFWLQHRLWGDTPFGYHLVNVLLHAGCAVLLVLVVARLFAPDDRMVRSTDGRKSDPLTIRSSDHPPTSCALALLAGLIFAVHPVYVESVAWISEQKNTFSLLWYLLAGWVYLGMPDTGGGVPSPRVRTPGGGTRPASIPWYRSGRYWLATLFFLLAILSKSLTATLPCALLVLVWWRRGRLSWDSCAPLVPWVLCGFAAGAFTGWVEHAYIGAKGDDYALGPIARGVLAGRVIWFYLAKYAWPAELSFIYPRWDVDAGQGWQWLFPLGAVALLVALWRYRTRARGPLAGYLLFVGSLVPTIGFFNVYAFKFSYVADHWNYLPSLSLAVMAAWGVVALAGKFAGRAGTPFPAGQNDNSGGERSRRPTGWIVGVGALILVLGTHTWRQTAPYRDLETFYREGLRRNPDSWMMHQNLGVLLVQTGRVEEAIPHFLRELELRPREAEAENNLGAALAKLGREAEALTHFERAVQLKPKYAEAWLNVGIARRDQGRIPEAIAALEECIRLQPQAAEAFFELGSIHAEAGRHPAAIARFEQALQARPDYSAALEGLGRALAAAGRPRDAIARLEQALALAPNPDLYDGLGALLAATGQRAAAQQRFEQALALDPRRAGTHFNLGILLAQTGRVPAAVQELERAVALKPDYAEAYLALAQGYEETGRPAEARAAQARASQLRPAR
jgi:tetratricopeptide (TPR) repeat protein